MAWEFDKNKPIYIQLVEIIKFKIAAGELAAGDKFTSVRDLAEEADVNPNTMQRALGELEREELLYSKRTSGRFVTEDKEKINMMRKELASKDVKELKMRLSKLGYKEDEVLRVITDIIKEED